MTPKQKFEYVLAMTSIILLAQMAWDNESYWWLALVVTVGIFMLIPAAWTVGLLVKLFETNSEDDEDDDHRHY